MVVMAQLGPAQAQEPDKAVPKLNSTPLAQLVGPQAEWINEAVGRHYYVHDPLFTWLKGSMYNMNWAIQRPATGLLQGHTHFYVENAPSSKRYLSVTVGLFLDQGRLTLFCGSWHGTDFTMHLQEYVPLGEETDWFYIAVWKDDSDTIGWYVFNDTTGEYVVRARYFDIYEGSISHVFACTSLLEYSDPSFARDTWGTVRWQLLLWRNFDTGPWNYECFAARVTGHYPYERFPDDQMGVCWISQTTRHPYNTCASQNLFWYRYTPHEGCKLDRRVYLPLALNNY